MNKFSVIFIILILVILYFNTSINLNALEKSVEQSLEQSLEISVERSLEKSIDYLRYLVKVKPHEQIIDKAIIIVLLILVLDFIVVGLVCLFKKRDIGKLQIKLFNSANNNNNYSDSSNSININSNYSGLKLFNKFNQDIRTNLLALPRVNINQVLFCNENLGIGHFGSVKKAIYLGHQVAIKTGNKFDQFTINEIKCHTLLAGHKNIIDIHGCFNFEMTRMPSYILELMDMNLQDYLIKNKNRLKSQHHTMFRIIYEIIDGIKYMHHNGFAHVDLHPGNILVKNNASGEFGPSKVKISDFGLCKYLPNDTLSNSSSIGYNLFMSPECNVSGRRVFEKCDDVYSLAVIVWLMFSFLAYGSKIDNLLDKFMTHGVPALEFKVLPFNLESLIRNSMGSRDSRPTIQEFEFEVKMAQAKTYHYESMGPKI